jgi:hypothetical protein
MEFAKDKIKQLIKEELEKVLIKEDLIDKWAFQNDLNVEYTKEEGQKIVFLTNDEAAGLTLPTYPTGAPVEWSVERRPDGKGYIIYSGNYR